MSNSFTYKTERPWPNHRLKIGAVVGHTTATTCRLWIRTGDIGEYTVLVYPNLRAGELGDFLRVLKKVPYDIATSRQPFIPHKVSIKNFGTDTTHVLDLQDLSPDTTYGYALYDDHERRVILGQDRPHTFRTFPGGGSYPFSFGFYSCHMPYLKSLFGKTTVANMDIWDCFDNVLSRHRDKDLKFLIAGGDQVYADGVKTLDIWEYLNRVMRKQGEVLLPCEEDMVSWYRDIYRGYWGFDALRKVFSETPVYMTWDDHEIRDGWGSYFFKHHGSTRDELNEIFPGFGEKGLADADVKTLLDRMFSAAKKVYGEYEHSHNPATALDQFDYGFKAGAAGFYFLDGRGQRNINRPSARILGTNQMGRLKKWLADAGDIKFLFVVSAVPVVHMMSVLANADKRALIDRLDLEDDLRDSWEHDLHDAERAELMEILFEQARKKVKVCILSGDVHIAAVFKVSDPKTGAVLYQLTSSAITYDVSRPLGWILSAGVPDEGEMKEGYKFERRALYADSNFSLIKVDPETGKIVFQLYGNQSISPPPGIEGRELEDSPVPHSIAKITLDFEF